MHDTYHWYAQLQKPSWAPPRWVFGPVWTALYIGIAISFGAVFVTAAGSNMPFVVVLPFILNLVFNFAYTPIQFGLRNNLLAAIDVVLVWGTLIWACIAIYPYLLWVVFANIAYFLWVTFASVLQITIAYLNNK